MKNSEKNHGKMERKYKFVNNKQNQRKKFGLFIEWEHIQILKKNISYPY